jgi:hypothetical protein
MARAARRLYVLIFAPNQSGAESGSGQTEKNSARAYIFRSSPKNGHWFSQPKHCADPNFFVCETSIPFRRSTVMEYSSG